MCSCLGVFGFSLQYFILKSLHLTSLMLKIQLQISSSGTNWVMNPLAPEAISGNVRSITYKFQKIHDVQQFEHN